jgi:alginate O-acetyltransferase complex protein AlgI
MLFNSTSFLLFLPLVFALYWLVNKKLVLQNWVLLLASLVFYAFWDWRFLFLLSFSIVLDYISGIQIEKSTTQLKRKTWLILSVAINLAFLGFFKYFNFFIDSFASLLNSFGFETSPNVLNILLPVGISFYTFHGLSYIIDIYKNRIKAEKNAVQYSLFVSYFPLLVAGPIERATHLLPQLKINRKFSYEMAVSGCRQILWGFFKKIVIADNCAEYVNIIFEDYTSFNGITLLFGAMLFAFQIYGDFSGYSDIALGVSRLFGIELLKNFSFPYFSTSIAMFWQRWHISLSSWFRDYVYIPLGGNRNGKWTQLRNVMIIFSLSGFWHGANLTFIVWGVIHGLLFIPSILISSKKENLFQNYWIQKSFFGLKMVITFTVVSVVWVFFRAENISKACAYTGKIFTIPSGSVAFFPKYLMVLIALMLIVEWFGKTYNFALEKMKFITLTPVRWTFYMLLISVILLFMQSEETPFIYFQF